MVSYLLIYYNCQSNFWLCMVSSFFCICHQFLLLFHSNLLIWRLAWARKFGVKMELWMSFAEQSIKQNKTIPHPQSFNCHSKSDGFIDVFHRMLTSTSFWQVCWSWDSTSRFTCRSFELYYDLLGLHGFGWNDFILKFFLSIFLIW